MNNTILALYHDRPFKRFTQRKLYLTVGFFAFIYGFMFGLTTTYLLVQLAIPLVILALLVIWMLPETGRVPARLLEKLFFAFLIGLLCWPDYLAIAIRPIPWITVVRLIMTPLALVFLLCLSQSSRFRGELADILNAVPAAWKLLLAFWIFMLVSVPLSPVPFNALNALIVATLNWIFYALMACYVLAQPGRMQKFVGFIWFIVLLICAIGVQEARKGQVIWVGHIPSFLQIDAPGVVKSLSGMARAGLGVHRVQSKFTTPLGFAEFLACAMPFILYMAVFSRKFVTKAAAALTIVLMFYNISKTDSRLGMVGGSIAILLFILFWGVVKWKRDPDSLLGPSAVFAFPATALTFVTASLFWRRLYVMLWGSGAAQASTDARQTQMNIALPKIASHPWGYGFNQGAGVVGYVDGGGNLTLDSYYLTLALDLGVLGFLSFMGMFGVILYKAGMLLLKRKTIDTDYLLLGATTICLIEFIIIKSIFSQTENHAFFFAVMGGAFALLYRITKTDEAARARLPQAPRP